MAGRGLSFLGKRARQLANIANNQLQHQRAFGAAAALAYDYDYDYDCDHYYYSDDLKKPMLDGEGSEPPRRGLQWVIIGEPGSRKHLYADWLSKLLHVPHICMSTLLTHHQLTPTSYLYNQIENAVNQGKLVPEDIVFGLLSKKLEEGYSRGETGFILDGIPRTRMQAEVLDQIADIDLVLNFKCAEKHLQQNEAGNGPSLQSHGSWVRSFPEEAVWKEKRRTYSEQSKPLEDYYRKQKKLLDFEVGGEPGETWQGLLSVLQLQHMNSSFQKLTA